MGKRKSPEMASDRERKWDKVFNSLVKLSQNLQKDRDFLGRRVKSLQEIICRMKTEQKFETMKAELMLGLKEREAFIYKHRYDRADDELSSLEEWLDCVSQKISEPKATSDDVGNKGKDSQNKALRDEVRKLKSDFEKYKEEKNSEISALLAEKNFVWNQFNKIENDFAEKLRKKCAEVEHASENVQLIINRAEQLQLENEKLTSNLAKLESESAQKSEEICILSRELELLKSRLGSEPPSSMKKSVPVNTVEKVTRTKQTACKSTGGKVVKRQLAIKESSSFKRKPIQVMTILDTPKLFSSSFKVPKLRPSFSPQAI